MKHREVWKVIVFGIITLGIYDIYWLYSTRKEMVALGQKIPRLIILFLPIIALLATALIQFIAGLASGSASVNGDMTRGVPAVVNIITILLGVLSVIGMIVISIYWFYQYSKAVYMVTAGQVSIGLSMGLLILLNAVNVGFVWCAIIQDGLNKVGQPSPVGQPVQPVAAGFTPPTNPMPPTDPTPPTQV